LLRIASIDQLRSHTRFLVTLRSVEGAYHQLILFRLANGDALLTRLDTPTSDVSEYDILKREQMYAMEAACPHLGADMSHAEIEECETGVVAVCPWHRCV
jgi:hypothetical protein